MAGPQDNWLITQLINRTVNRTSLRLPQVSVMIEFEMQDCDVTLNCQRTFNTHIYETSAENSAAARNISNYRQVQRVSPDVTTGARVTGTIVLNFNTSHSSFYFAIQDETTCMVITRLIIFYTVCPAQTANLIHYPETVALSSDFKGASIPYTQVFVLCVQNAQPENGSTATANCSSAGIWNTIPGAGCRCIPGYFQDELETCRRKLLINLGFEWP